MPVIDCFHLGTLAGRTCVYKTHDWIQEDGAQSWHCQANDELVILSQSTSWLELGIPAR